MGRSTAELDTYRTKRDFSRTAEPPPVAAPVARTGPLTFVVQKHAAGRLHYDFRLEVDGVLKSWPIPKGPSYDPHERRLAVMTEDHPLAYAQFEGVIPKGEYGGGEMIVWDAGIYAPEVDGRPEFERERAEELVRRGIERGRLTVMLHGQKLSGLWTLVHTQAKEWLFLKKDDAYADASRAILDEDASILSGLTIDDLRAGKRPAGAAVTVARVEPGGLPGARRATLPTSIAPMLPVLTERAFSDPAWLFEPKLDGYRVLASLDGGEVRLASRRGLEATSQYPWLVKALREQPFGQMILDGEIVALDEAGRTSFQNLQNRASDPNVCLVYYVFDILYRDGFDVRGVGLEQRKALLAASVVAGERVRLVDAFPEIGETLFEAAQAAGMEGVVGKRRDSKYETGKRSDAWRKVKATLSHEFVVGGFTPGTGSRARTFGSLVLGYYRAGAAQLSYVGNVGSGFDDRTLAELHARLKGYRIEESPFDAEVPTMGRWTRPNRAEGPITWVRPELVAEVKFAEQTHEGILRAPVFLRLREDRVAGDVGPMVVAGPPDGGDGGAPPPDPLPREGENHSALEKSSNGSADDGEGENHVALEKSSNGSADDREEAASGLLKSGNRSASDGVGEAVVVRARSSNGAAPQESEHHFTGNILDQLGQRGNRVSLEVEGQTIAFSNLDKVFWPALGEQRALTKRDLAGYCARVAPYVLPHLRDRPLTLVRFPNGIHGQHFYQKHYEQPLPPFVETVWLWSDHNKGDGEYLLCNNLPTLLWLAQVADLELHTWYSRVDPAPDAAGRGTTFAGSLEIMQQSTLNYPDFIVFDLDPYLYSGKEARGAEPELHRAGFDATCQVALWLKEILDDLSLASFVKTTGRTGLHIYVPIVRNLDYGATHSLSATIATYLVQAHPKEATVEWAVDKRTGKVFVDYNQNIRGKTLASIYSPRVLPWAAVSMPLSWSEVGTVFPTDFTLLTAPDRLAQVGDLWAPILAAKHDMGHLLGLAGGVDG